jgi:hypothetical protein
VVVKKPYISELFGNKIMGCFAGISYNTSQFIEDEESVNM